MFGMPRWNSLKSIACVCCALALAAVLPRPGLAQVTTQNATQNAGLEMWRINPLDDIVRNLNELELNSRGSRAGGGAPGTGQPHTVSLEIRSSDNARRVAAIPASQHDARTLLSPGNPQMVARFVTYQDLPSVPAGEYVAAWIVDNQRRSNVFHFTVDPKKDVAKLPRVRIVQFEPDKAGSLPVVAAYVSRAKASDPAPDRMMLAFSILVLDDVAMPHGGGSGPGNNSTLPVGGTDIASTRWTSTPDLTKPHTIAVRAGNGSGIFPPPSDFKPGEFQESATVILETGTPLADAWDKATPKLATMPAEK